jgi:hypothetical protein
MLHFEDDRGRPWHAPGGDPDSDGIPLDEDLPPRRIVFPAMGIAERPAATKRTNGGLWTYPQARARKGAVRCLSATDSDCAMTEILPDGGTCARRVRIAEEGLSGEAALPYAVAG